MKTIINNFASSMAFENGISFDAAMELVTWLGNEGVLDSDILRQTYNTEAANDA